MLVVSSNALAEEGAQMAAPANDYTRSVDRPFEKVLAAVEDAAKEKGFRVTNVHDVTASLRKDNIVIEPYATVEICNPRMAAQVLEAEPRLGSLLPCRIAVYKQGDKTVVSTALPSRLVAMFPVSFIISAGASEVDDAMKDVIDTATR